MTQTAVLLNASKDPAELNCSFVTPSNDCETENDAVETDSNGCTMKLFCIQKFAIKIEDSEGGLLGDSVGVTVGSIIGSVVNLDG